MSTRTFFLLAALVLAGPVQAAGQHAGGHDHGPDARVGAPGDRSRVTRTVHVAMNDAMRFVPARIDVRRGETVRFVIRNLGALRHEFVLDTAAGHRAHAEQMKRFPEMEHDQPNMLTLPPGGQGELVWHFTQAGSVPFACLQAGHYDAGMKGRVRVSSSRSPS